MVGSEGRECGPLLSLMGKHEKVHMGGWWVEWGGSVGWEELKEECRMGGVEGGVRVWQRERWETNTASYSTVLLHVFVSQY